MGQYHYVCNLDKKQFLHPHKLGDGLKLREFGCSGAGTMTALAFLLAGSNRGGARGGGDFRPSDTTLLGSWCGDRIAIIGDYHAPDDVNGMELPNGFFNIVSEEEDGWRNISDDVGAVLRETGDIDRQRW